MQPVLSFCLVLLGLLTTSVAKHDDQLWPFGKHLNKGDNNQYKDCNSVRKAGYNDSGVYMVWYNSTTPYKVVCNHTADNSFTIIQRRMYGDVNFNRGWQDYVYGFGHPQGDFWAGLNSIYYSTLTGQIKMTVYMQDFQGIGGYIKYDYFKLNGPEDQYRLLIANAFGNVPDDLGYNDKSCFYTYDRPDPNNCARNMMAGWWYNYCTLAHPNGYHYPYGPYTPSTGYYNGIFWKDWLGFGYSLKFISMTLSDQ
ncbi:fibrinogen-like protein 1 [Mizuhopecten yessoensis]|uniref:fibrinogen-like protein 1 n=1 Tax=Mizuhopecten yessoensis TaxID=6573 RepID=UPI000B45871E|nr:fibrinogen-like protein 1 [Mizuhopecten yessoensis]